MYHYLSLNLKQQENKKFNQLIIIPTYLFTLALALEFKGKKNKKKFTETTLRFDSQKEKRKKERLILFLFFFFFWPSKETRLINYAIVAMQQDVGNSQCMEL